MILTIIVELGCCQTEKYVYVQQCDNDNMIGSHEKCQNTNVTQSMTQFVFTGGDS